MLFVVKQHVRPEVRLKSEKPFFEADKSCVQCTTYVQGVLYLITVFTLKALATVM